MRDRALDVIRRNAIHLDLETSSRRLLQPIDPDVSLVATGEATRGTHEFYRIRADLTTAPRRPHVPRWTMAAFLAGSVGFGP